MKKRIGISDVAAYAGVSVATVSRTLNDSDLVTQKTKKYILQTIKELGYQPNDLARGLRLKKSNTIGVIVSNVVNPFFMSVVSGIESVANKYGYSIILCNSDENTEKEKSLISNLESKQVDGLIIATTGQSLKDMAFIEDKPVIFLDRRPPSYGEDLVCDTVLVKNIDGSRMATNYLISKGYRNIGFINGSMASLTGQERFQGYKEALDENGITYSPELVKESDFLGNHAYDAAVDLIQNPECEAIFSGNNQILNKIMRAAKDLGIMFPRDKGLATFDDIDWLNYCESKITSVKQPSYEIGISAMEMLYERLNGYKGEYREIMLDVSLIVR